MKRLSRRERVLILSLLVESMSVSATARVTDISKDTILKLMVEVGELCRDFLDRTLHGLTCQRVQADEMWSFVGKKKKRASEAEQAAGLGDAWLWLALDADTKLIITFLVGSRDATSASIFIEDLAARLTHRIQLTTDGYGPYLEAVEGAFGCEVDFAQLVKLYGTPEGSNRRQYIGARKTIITGEPDDSDISTSFSERFNLTIRMSDRRFIRKTSGYSKKPLNHFLSVALHVMHYNFIRIHMTLNTTPAVAAGVADHEWTLDELVMLLEKQETVPKPRGHRPYKPHGLEPIRRKGDHGRTSSD